MHYGLFFKRLPLTIGNDKLFSGKDSALLIGFDLFQCFSRQLSIF